MGVNVKVASSDPNLIRQLVELTVAGTGASERVPPGLTVKLGGGQANRAGLGVPLSDVCIVLQWVAPVATDLIANWLYDFLRGRNAETTITIEDKEVEILADRIARRLEELDAKRSRGPGAK